MRDTVNTTPNMQDASHQNVNICTDSVFTTDMEGLVMNGAGVARMDSALDGIQTIAAILMQRELDLDMDGGIAISQKAAVGLINALGTCVAFAKDGIGTRTGHSRVVATCHPAYAQIENMVKNQ